ncbi:tRNA (guanosine(37)-N1)-methyltransferase TrmD [Nakamurella lactea]|uniref:tRNA (guanosine(37)-N1)-methyltransferase TrmD n=1 Tax=Nakamurella lactea TaxID=459515 RepID=UPI00041E9ECB|nr:tRNA (guanosine(37)-N1)-methyltransferase TrmD [Nakamurella lactea]
MHIDIVTIFGEYLSPLRESLLGKAIEDGLIGVGIHDLRNWTTDRHRTVDDPPYGGGPGMVMKADVWGAALDAVTDGVEPPPTLIVPTPAGRPFTQQVAAELSILPRLVFACGRYEGIDQRVIDEAAGRMPVRELSIGDYVLAGGEVAVLVMVEAIARLIPGVLGNPESAVDDSFGAGLTGLVEAPSYTRPPTYRGLDVPEVLLGGNHAAIERHRRDESLRRTAANRPDLLAELTADQLDGDDLDVLLAAGVSPPAGLAERVAAERAARAAKKARRRRS